MITEICEENSISQVQDGAALDIADHPITVYLSTLTTRTRKTVLSDLKTIAGMAGFSDPLAAQWETLKYAHVQAIRSQLAEKYAPGTANRMLCALRGVLRACWRLNRISGETYHQLIDVQSVRGSRITRGRAVTAEERDRIFALCAEDDSRIARRDETILALLYGGGLRREEAANIRINNYVAHTGELRVFGKGNKERIIHITNGTKTAIDRWMRVRKKHPTEDAGWMFCAIDRWDNADYHKPMSHHAIYNVFIKRCEAAGITDLSPHDFRRTFVSELLDNGVDIKTVADMAGHTNIATTAHYDRRSEDAKIEAAKTIYVPIVN